MVCQDDQVLLVRRATEPWLGFWDVPGGFCDAGEHPRDTALREVREETGLDVELTGLLGMWIDEYRGASDVLPAETTLNIYFLARPPGRMTLNPDSEISEVAWFGAEDLPADIAFPAHLPAVLEAWSKALPSRTENVSEQ